MIRNPRSKNKKTLSILFAVGIFLVIVLLRYFAPTFTGNIAMVIASPVMKSSDYAGAVGASVLDIFTSKHSLQTENTDLKNQLAELQVAQDRDKLLVQENADLKELLGRHSSNTSILASVISKPPLSLYDTIVVDVGAAEKVSVGDKVLALGTVPIGTIHAVYAHTSIAQLFSSVGERINVKIGKNIQTTAEAQGGGSFIIKLPKDTAVAVGDPIAAPGIGADIFGTVETIETNENDPFIYVRFCLPVNMSELNFVQIDRVGAI